MIKLIDNQSYKIQIEEVAGEADGTTKVKGWSIDLIRGRKLSIAASVGEKIIPVTKFVRQDLAIRFGINHEEKVGFEFILPSGIDRFSFLVDFPAGPKSRNLSVKRMLKEIRNQRICHLIGTGMKIPGLIVTARGREKLAGAIKRRVKPAQDWYQDWIAKNENENKQVAIASIDSFELKPKISIAVPVYNVEEKWLRRFIQSVQEQWYPNWELCIADDHSPSPHVRRVLDELSSIDSRIKIVYRTDNGQISKATNSALQLATGDFIGFMDNDDELAPQALYKIVQRLNEQPKTDFLYSDEDKINENGVRFDPFFKPGFNPQLLLSHNYITHFVVVSAELLNKVGELRSEFDGSQDYDFVLRATEQAQHIEHVAEILYHWRTLSTSVAGDPRSKMYAYEAGQRALEEALSRRGIKATVKMLENLGTYKISFAIAQWPSVEVVGQGYSSKDFKALEKGTSYPDVSFTSVGRFADFSDSTADYIVFLDNIQPKAPEWLKEMVNTAQYPRVGIVGGKVYDKEQRVIDAGVTLRALKSGEVFEARGEWEEGIGYYFRTLLPRAIFAVTEECLLISAKDFQSLDGFNSLFGSGVSGLHLSNRLSERLKKTVVWEPYSSFVDLKTTPLHIAQSSRDAFLKEHPNIYDPYSSRLFPATSSSKREAITVSIDAVQPVAGSSALRVVGWAADLLAHDSVDVSLPADCDFMMSSFMRSSRPDVNQMLGAVPLDAELGFEFTLSPKSQSQEALALPQLILTGEANRTKIIGLKKVQSPVVKRLRRGLHLISLLRHPRRVFRALRDRLISGRYQQWTYKRLIAKTEQYDAKQVQEDIARFKYKPLISFVMPVYNVGQQWLIKCVRSIQAQSYENWELCIADDNSTDPAVRETLEKLKSEDSRIHVVYRQENGHISRSSNSALESARGDFVALIDDDDEIAPFALYEVVKAINKVPGLDVIYSDEDKIDEEGKRFDPAFKPDYSPDLLLSTNYVSHLGVYRASIAKEIGGFRVGYEGSQDYDFLLRFMEKTSGDHIYHIPKVLYHWRALSTSTASNSGQKSYASDAGLHALQDALDRRGIEATAVSSGANGIYDIDYRVADEALVSIIIPTKNGYDNIDRLLTSIYELTNYANYEIIIADNGSTNPNMRGLYERYKKMFGSRLHVESIDIPFNFSTINNIAARKAAGKYLLFLNDDTKVIRPDWMRTMVSFAQQERVGVVGAKLYYPDDTIQHAGIVLGLGGVAGHIMIGTPRTHLGYFGRLIENANYYALTAACCMVKADDFWAVDGFDESLAVAYNDVDLCIRIHDHLGKDNVWANRVELYHFESQTRGYDIEDRKKKVRLEKEGERLKKRYRRIIEDDPYYNPNLSRTSGNFWIRN